MSDIFVPLHLARSLRTSLVLSILDFLSMGLRRRRDMAHLADLPDYLLEDVGLSRSDIRKQAQIGETLR
ncbi:DUF1127 domain-containing protein [Roseibium sp. LAB1]